MLTTSRLRIRPWTSDDVEAFHRIWGDPQVIFWGARHDRAMSELFLATRAIPERWMAIEDVEGIAGNVFLSPSREEPDAIELGYHLARRAWGRGYATEAAQAVLATGPDRAVAYVLVQNARSHAVMARLGFQDRGPIDHGGWPHRRYVWTRP